MPSLARQVSLSARTKHVRSRETRHVLSDKTGHVFSGETCHTRHVRQRQGRCFAPPLHENKAYQSLARFIIQPFQQGPPIPPESQEGMIIILYRILEGQSNEIHTLSTVGLNLPSSNKRFKRSRSPARAASMAGVSLATRPSAVKRASASPPSPDLGEFSSDLGRRRIPNYI